MALPASLQSIRMTDATTGDQIDNKVGDLEKALCDIFGIPIDTAVAAALLEVSANGLTKVNFQDLASNPTAIGQLARNGNLLKYHNGAVRTVACSVGSDVTEPAVVNTAIQAALYSTLIEGGSLGTNGFIHGHVEVSITSILNGASLQLLFYYGGVSFFAPTVFNNSGGTINFTVGTDFMLHGRNSAVAQVYSITSVIGIENAFVNWGVNGFSTLHRGGLIAVNSAVDQPFQLNVIWSAASASNSVSGLGIDIFRPV